MRKKVYCPKCGRELIRHILYDDAYAGESRWKTKGWHIPCNGCKSDWIVEKNTYKAFSYEQWKGKSKYNAWIYDNNGKLISKHENIKEGIDEFFRRVKRVQEKMPGT